MRMHFDPPRYSPRKLPRNSNFKKKFSIFCRDSGINLDEECTSERVTHKCEDCLKKKQNMSFLNNLFVEIGKLSILKRNKPPQANFWIIMKPDKTPFFRGSFTFGWKNWETLLTAIFVWKTRSPEQVDGWDTSDEILDNDDYNVDFVVFDGF